MKQSRSLAFLSPTARVDSRLQGSDNLFRLESTRHTKGQAFRNLGGEKLGLNSKAGDFRDEKDLFKLYVELKHEDKSDYKRLVLATSRLFNVVQLKRQIEKEFRVQFPRDPEYFVKKVCLTSGYQLGNAQVVAEVLKAGQSVVCFPEKEKLYQHSCDQFCTCQFKTPATDLVSNLKDQQHQMASKLIDASIRQFDDKLAILKQIAALGMSEDVQLVQNLSLSLNKLVTRQTAFELDREEHGALLSLVVLVLQHWVVDLIDQDQLTFLNTLQVLDCLAKSWSFCSAFKQSQPAMDKLAGVSQDKRLGPAERQLAFRVAQALSSTIDVKTIPLYNKAEFLDWKKIEEACEPDGVIISKSDLYKAPFKRKNFERASVAKKSANFAPSEGDRVLGSAQGIQYSKPCAGCQEERCAFHSQEEREISKYRSQPPSRLQESQEGAYLVNPYKVTFFKGEYPSLEKLPPIQMQYSGQLLRDYCKMLNPDVNVRDIVTFALHSIDNMGQKAVQEIMQSKELFLYAFLLFEFHNFPHEVAQSQHRVCGRLVKHLSRERAIDLVQNNGLSRMQKRFKFQSSGMKKQVSDLFQAALTLGKEHVDVPFLINLTLCPFQELRNVGMKTLCEVTECADLTGNHAKRDRIDASFHIHVPYLVQCCDLRADLKREQPQLFLNYALQVICNLCNRAYLKHYITFNKGLEVLVEAVKDTKNVNGMRIATQALANLASGDEELRVKLMTTLRREIDAAWKGTGDPLVSEYLKKMLKEGINFDN